MKFFATLFDKNYLSRGIILYQSIQKTGTPFTLYVLCLDDITFTYFEENKKTFTHAQPVLLSELEQYDFELLNSKENRSRVEYYFTLSPCWPLFLLTKYNLPHICTLDADICFYATPQPLFDYLENNSVIITPHKFSTELKALEKYGLFNVSFQIFKNNKAGNACLQKWREQCLRNCSDALDEKNQVYADQLYLNSWPTDYPGEVKVLDDSVSGLAPWNINMYPLVNDKDIYTVEGERLIYFHFQYFKILNNHWATNGFERYRVKAYNYLNQLYASYWNEIERINHELAIQADHSLRVNLKVSKIVTIIRERKVYFKIKNSIFVFNVRWIPKFIRTLLIKIYG